MATEQPTTESERDWTDRFPYAMLFAGAVTLGSALALPPTPVGLFLAYAIGLIARPRIEDAVDWVDER